MDSSVVITGTWATALGLSAFSASALILKAYFLSKIRFDKRNPVTTSFLAFGSFLLLMNLIELTAYLLAKVNPQYSILIIHYAYFTAMYFSFSAMLLFALSLSGISIKKISLILYAASLALSVLHIKGYIINGVTLFNDYALIRDAAAGYWLFEIFSIGTSIAAVTVLIYSIRTTDDNFISSRNKVALVGLAPFPIGSSAIIILMHFGVNISPALVVPIMTVYLVAVCMQSTKSEILDLSINWHLSKKLLVTVLKSFSTNPGTLTQRIARIEHVSIEIAIFKSGGVQKDAAKLMGISESTLCRKLAKFNAEEEAKKSLKENQQQSKPSFPIGCTQNQMQKEP